MLDVKSKTRKKNMQGKISTNLQSKVAQGNRDGILVLRKLNIKIPKSFKSSVSNWSNLERDIWLRNNNKKSWITSWEDHILREWCPHSKNKAKCKRLVSSSESFLDNYEDLLYNVKGTLRPMIMKVCDMKHNAKNT